MLVLVFVACDKGNLPPMAKLTAFPSFGDSTLLFEFNAGESEDDRSFSISLQYRWDFNEDGVWDTEFTKSSAITHRFIHPGIYSVAVEVRDIDGLSATARDTVTVFGMNREIDTLTDSRDGNRYRIVRLGGRWWMAENLRYGVVIPTDREQTENDTVEMYRLDHTLQSDTIGGIYLWYEALNYNPDDPQGICPEGWHIPAKPEWEALFSPYPRIHSLDYYRKGGLSGLNLDLSNGGERWDDGTFWRPPTRCYTTGFWSSSDSIWDWEHHPYHCSFSSAELCLSKGWWHNTGLTRYYSIRCIKDE